MSNINADLSITRIAGLTWNEWNARLAMPLVTQLREGVNPLVFPTDLSINTMDKAGGSALGGGVTPTLDCKSPAPETSNDMTSLSAATDAPLANATLNRSSSSASGIDKLGTATIATGSVGGKMKHLTEEEAAILMLKATVEKSTAAAAAANNSGNLSDASYGEDVANAGSSAISNSGEYHTALSGAAAFADINILSNISALNSLIGAGGNGIGGSAAAGAGGGGGGLSVSGSGHPCPECGRVYKLKSSLRNHQKWECGKEPQFQCPFCVYRAKQKMHIGRHMERMHKEKFIKLEDLKSFTGNSGDDSGSAPTAAALAANTASELRQNFS